MPEEIKNLGVLAEPSINPNQNFFGALTVIEPKVLEPNRDFTKYLGKYEPQSNTFFDSQACVTFSALNCVEILINRMIQKGEVDGYMLMMLKDLGYVDEQDQFNGSDRFTAKISGTTSRGNYLSKVADSIAEYGILPEKDWPFDATIKTFEDFYRPFPIDLVNKARKFLDIFDYGWEWVGASAETIHKALETSPLQVTVQVGSPKNALGYYVNREDMSTESYGHAVSCYSEPSYRDIFDHYPNTYKKYAPSYKFGHAIRFFIRMRKPTTMPINPLNLPSNCLVYVQTDLGFKKSYYMGPQVKEKPILSDKMIIDTAEKIEDTWKQRNAGTGVFKDAPVRTITLDQWNQYTKANFKGEIINQTTL